MKIQVTVELEVNNLPDADARALARELVEARGLRVSSVRLTADKAAGKTFIPKAGKPGSVVMANGVAYVVWDLAQHQSVWATKRDNPDGLFYKVGNNWAEAYHPNGTRHNRATCECKAVA